VAVNCAAIPAELLESEMFGHARGSFTGAVKDRPGRFRQADRGTLFLDEVAEIPVALQGKLLRALQEKAVDAVGADRPVPVDARIVAATNRNLSTRIREGTFREDLFYRLNVVELPVPPLRERPEDIPLLVASFLDELAPGRDVAIPPAVMEEIVRRPWPGNVRELKNACERMVVLCAGDEVSPADLPPAPRGLWDRTGEDASAEWPPLPAEGLSLVDLEKRMIERALRLKGGNITQAAAYLRIPRHILVYRLGKYGIRRDG
jgi:two-component system NtrC family response regulator